MMKHDVLIVGGGLSGLRAAVGLAEHLPVMIELENQSVAPLQVGSDVRRDMTGVRQQSEASPPRLEEKLARLPRIVGNGKRQHLQVTEREPAGMAVDAVQRWKLAIAGVAVGAGGHPDGQCIASGQGAQATDVVAMLMGHQYAVKGLRIDREFCQPLFDLARGEAAIDQQPDMGCFQQQGITPAATPQRSETQRHGSPYLLVDQAQNTLGGL